jgi:hypothetical protein
MPFCRRARFTHRLAGAKSRIDLFAMPFETKSAMILPRQARDKHRESTQKRDDAFFAQDSFDLDGDGDGDAPPPPPPAVGGQHPASGVDEDDMVEV